jgi:hypothetical protein
MKEVTYEEWQKNPTPREMWVWDDDIKQKEKAKVVYICSGNHLTYRVMTVNKLNNDYQTFQHCAEIEEQKTRRMTNQELAWWLREKPTREYKRKYQISVYYEYVYTDEEADELVEEDIVIRENGGEWHEPLVEVEE